MNEHLKHLNTDVKLIYSHLGDEISRQIFENRLLMTLTQNIRSDDNIVFLRKRRDADKRLIDVFDEIKRLNGDILIYGAGECGRYICDSKYMNGISVQGFIDNREWHKGTIHGLPVYQLEDAVKKYKKANIILCMQSGVSRRQIREQISRRNNDWRIIDVGEILYEIDKQVILEMNIPCHNYIYNIVNTSSVVSELFDRIRKSAYPTACWITYKEGDDIGKLMKEKWGYLPWCCYLVCDIQQKEYNGVPVYTYENAVTQYDKLDIVIESESERDIARKKIASLGMTGECIDLNDITEALYRKQYFDFFEYTGSRESFVDGGAYDLGSTEAFMEWCDGNYRSVFVFEPEKSNYEICKGKICKWNNVQLFNYGLFDRQGRIGFTAGMGGASRIENQDQDFYADYDIEVADLDSVVQEEHITFIKMDIEGAEEKALLGARRIITEQKPKLAICVYHKPEDIVELPALVLGMRPDYKIAFRHYSLRATETVMYAW